jgi:sterol desaturase/sphingolipid hydroxylase (fatty acid hydroxylase superfamily)
MQELLRLRIGSDRLLLLTIASIALPFIALAIFALRRSGRIPAVMSSRQRGLWTDLGFMLMSPFADVVSRIITTFVLFVCALLVGRVATSDVMSGFGPVVRQPRWLVLTEMVVLSDFIYYWTHRAAHTVPALWRLHAIHHSTRHLRSLSALRAHPAEVYVQICNMVPLFLLGFPPEGLAPLAPIFMLYGFVIHANVPIAVRPLSYILNSPMFHAWHHVLDEEAKKGGTNFAGLFPIWDALFGTYRLPEHLPAEYGTDGEPLPDGCINQVLYPFTGLREDSTAASNVEPIAAKRAAPESANGIALPPKLAGQTPPLSG